MVLFLGSISKLFNWKERKAAAWSPFSIALRPSGIWKIAKYGVSTQAGSFDGVVDPPASFEALMIRRKHRSYLDGAKKPVSSNPKFEVNPSLDHLAAEERKSQKFIWQYSKRTNIFNFQHQTIDCWVLRTAHFSSDNALLRIALV